jgi:hypothetical protein
VRRALVTLATAALALAGCAGDGSATDQDEIDLPHAETSDLSPAPTTESELPDVEGPAPTVDELAGVWNLHDVPAEGWDPLLAQMDRDGNAVFDLFGRLDTSPAVVATYTHDGDTISFVAEPDSEICPGDSWTWRVGVPEDGRLHIVFTEGGCTVPLGAEWAGSRVSPRSAAGAEITFDSAADGFVMPSVVALRGIWLLEGEGVLLRMSGGGTYARDDAGQLAASPVDAGTFEFEDGTLIMTSGSDSEICAEGDVRVFEDVRINGRVLQTTSVTDACEGADGAELRWLRLSP